VSWLWWNPAGLALAAVVALAIDRAAPAFGSVRWPPLQTALLLAAFAAMLLALVLLPSLLALLPTPIVFRTELVGLAASPSS
jgi:hypothetical protein